MNGNSSKTDAPYIYVHHAIVVYFPVFIHHTHVVMIFCKIFIGEMAHIYWEDLHIRHPQNLAFSCIAVIW